MRVAAPMGSFMFNRFLRLCLAIVILVLGVGCSESPAQVDATGKAQQGITAGPTLTATPNPGGYIALSWSGFTAPSGYLIFRVVQGSTNTPTQIPPGTTFPSSAAGFNDNTAFASAPSTSTPLLTVPPPANRPTLLQS